MNQKNVCKLSVWIELQKLKTPMINGELNIQKVIIMQKHSIGHL